MKEREKESDGRVIFEIDVEWWNAKIRQLLFHAPGVRHAAFPRPFFKRPGLLFFPRKSKILPTSPGREDARQGEKREISKCSGIIKVYRFTAGRFSYANLAGGHPLGLFLQIFMAVCVREKWQTGWENANARVISFTMTLLSNKWKAQYTLHNCTVSMQCCVINYSAHFATSSFRRIFIYVGN